MPVKPKMSTGQVVNWDYSNSPTVYANVVAFSMTAYDIALTFGLVGNATPTEVDAHATVKVLLAPEQADNLMKLLGIAVKAYAENNGPLRSSGAMNVAAIEEQVEASRIKS